MSDATARRGILLWVDDELEGLPLPVKDPWGTILGGQSDRVFRLMDLTLEAASSVQEAFEVLDQYDHRRHYGTFIFCVLDLRIPASAHKEAQMKHGLALASALRKRGYPFVFLSAKSNAARSLDRADLGTVPYYVKEPADSPWRSMPETLKHVVLNEFNSRLAWLRLDCLTARFAPGSSCEVATRTSTQRGSLLDLAPTYFPFFDTYRDYVERCEYRFRFQPGRACAVRSERFHSDAFVQQSLLVMVASFIMRAQGRVRFDYGHADNERYFQTLQDPNRLADRTGIRVLRVNPNDTPPELLQQRLAALSQFGGLLILVVPSDESCDMYADLLRDRGIPTVGELPQDRSDDGRSRELVVRRAAEFVVGVWAEAHENLAETATTGAGAMRPELIINPIDWCILLETGGEVEELSDPFECIVELARALDQVPAGREQAIFACLQTGNPLPYDDLLRVGRTTFMASDLADDLPTWIDRALDKWLNVSWRFPHGLDNSATSAPAGRGEEAGVPASNKGPWRDSCFEVLIGMLEDRRAAASGKTLETGSAASDLDRVERFVEALGGRKFLVQGGTAANWDSLEFLRWPHLRYPMPLAVTTRLKDAGRFLWIQPDGLDLAAALPVGRQRYRFLVNAVEHYWSVLGWGSEVVPHLPLGWGRSIKYLLDVLRSRDVAGRWEREAPQFWDALLGLLRNASPAMFICDQIVRGKPLRGVSPAANEYLSSVQGYGKVLSRLRGSRKHRYGGYLWPQWQTTNSGACFAPDPNSEALCRAGVAGAEADDSAELVSTFFRFAGEVAGLGVGDDATRRDAPAELLARHAAALTESDAWFSAAMTASAAGAPVALPSLLSTRADHLWALLDAASWVDGATRRLRYYDGYHFLAVLNDLRVLGKDTRPQVDACVIEQVVDLFVASLEGLLAQLAVCVEIAGFPDLAAPLRPTDVAVVLPDGFVPPDPEDLASVFRVRQGKAGWEVYVMGVPGEAVKGRLCYHDHNGVKEWPANAGSKRRAR